MYFVGPIIAPVMLTKLTTTHAVMASFIAQHQATEMLAAALSK